MPVLEPDHNHLAPRPVVSTDHQPAVAILVAAALLCSGAWFVLSGGLAGRLVPYREVRTHETGFRIDVNRASRPELMQLPGVGPAMADRILEWRESRGPFRSPEDLLEVPGIGVDTLRRFEAYLSPPEAP